MASAAAQTCLTPEEYITFERKAPFKNEFISIGCTVPLEGIYRRVTL